jgi:ribonuclease P protein subunit POP4
VLIDSSNLIYHNLVGRRVRVISSTDPTQIGMQGKVVDETSHTLTISSGLGKRVVPKTISTFAFYLPEEAVVVGSEIALSPEDRLKKLQRRRK